MLSAIALIPCAPVMVPELAGDAASELRDLRDAVLRAAAALPDRWVVVGVGPDDDAVGSGAVGTFGGYGADVRVALSANGVGEPRPLPLCALIAGWVRGRAAPQASAEVRVYGAGNGFEAAMAHGRALRSEIDAAAEPIGVLVVADGANTLTPPAPGGYDPESVPAQEALDQALAIGDVVPLAGLPESVVGRVAYQVLAGLSGSSPPSSAREWYRGAPYGVGYFVGVWMPGKSEVIRGSIG